MKSSNKDTDKQSESEEQGIAWSTWIGVIIFILLLFSPLSVWLALIVGFAVYALVRWPLRVFLVLVGIDLLSG